MDCVYADCLHKYKFTVLPTVEKHNPMATMRNLSTLFLVTCYKPHSTRHQL